MNLFAIDRYSDMSSPVHRLDAIVKLPSFLTFVVAVVLLPSGSFRTLAVALVTLLCVALTSRVPMKFLIYRTVVVAPFVVLIGAFNLLGQGLDALSGEATSGSGALLGHTWASSVFSVSSPLPPIVAGSGALSKFLTMAGKSFVSVLSFTLLISTTGSARLLSAARRMGLPSLLTVATGFTLRYVFVLHDELTRLRRSWEARRLGRLAWLVELRYLGSLVGVLLIRSYERAERVYLAMCARGFDGYATVPSPSSFSRKDLAFPVLLLGPLTLVFLLHS